MITDITVQHELLKAALSATDNYLGIEQAATKAGTASPPMLKEFISNYNNAWRALESLGVLNQHQEYMNGHLTKMWSMANEEDATLADDPYSSSPGGGSAGGVDESKKFWDSAKKRADMPHEKLSPSMKARAKARASAAGRTYPNMVDNVWAAQQQESKVVSFVNFIGEEKELPKISEDEIDEMVNELSWENIYDLYDSTEIIQEELDIEDTEVLDEDISAQSRLKRRQGFARFKGKRNTIKGMKLKRTSTPDTLKARAESAARRSLYARLLRGRDKSSLSASEKNRIEKQVKKMKAVQSTLVLRMIPKIRAIEQKRLKNYRTAK